MPKTKNKSTSSIKDSVYSRKQAFSRFLGSDTHAFEGGKGYNMASAGVLTSAGHKVLFNGDTELSHFSNTEHEQKRRIAVCREMYENFGLVGNIIDLMVDFAMEDLTIEHTSPSIKNIYVNWARQVNLAGLAEGFLKAYYRDGNVPIFKMRGTVAPDEIQRLRRRVLAEEKTVSQDGKKKKKKKSSPTYSKTLAQNFEIATDVEKNRIPVRYRILNVLSLKKLGSDLLGTTHYLFHINRDERKTISKLTTTEAAEEAAALQKFRESVGDNAFDLFVSRGAIRLNKDQLDVIHYKKDDWQPWATPMLWRISPDVKFKQLLRDADISLAEGVVNALTVVKLGKAEKGFHPSPKAYRKMIDMMKNPSKSKTIVWDDLITIENVFPPTEKMLSEAKYQQVNKDILSGIGVPEFLVSGSASKGGFANAFLAARTLLERLEPGRKLFVEWVKKQFEEIRAALGFQKAAWIKMHNTSLKDQEVEQRFLLEMVDRNLISAQTLVERAGENFDIELQRMKNEDKLREQFEEESPMTLRKLGKFGPQITDGAFLDMFDEEAEAELGGVEPELDEDGNELPSGQEEAGNQGGRPKGTRRRRTREQGPRQPQGQNVSSLVDLREVRKEAEFKYAKLYAFLLEKQAAKRGVAVNELADSDRSKVYSAIIRVLAHTSGSKRITKKQVAHILRGEVRNVEAGVKLDRCVRSVVKQRVKKFRERNGKAPGADKMKEITSSAFAICRSQGLK